MIPSLPLNTCFHWNNFDQENFILDYLIVHWADVIKSKKKNIDFSIECFLKKFNLICDKYLPLKNLTKQIEIQNQALYYIWLTKISFYKKKLLTKFIKLKEPSLKNEP